MRQPFQVLRAGGERDALRELVRPYRGQMVILASTSFVGAILEASFLVLMTAIAMALVASHESIGPLWGFTVPLPVAIVLGAILLVVRLVLSLLGAWISARLAADVTTAQRRVLTRSFIYTSWEVQQGEPMGRLQVLATGFVAAAAGAISTLSSAITALLSLAAFLATGLLIDPLSTLAVVVALAVVGALLGPVRRRIKGLSTASAQAGLGFANAVSELGSLGLEMQTFGVQSRFAHHIDSLSDETVRIQRRVQLLSGTIAPIYMSLAYAAVLAGVAVLTILDVEGLATIGAVMLLMLRSLSYGQQAAAAAGHLAGNTPFLESVREIVARYDASPASGGGTIPDAASPLVATDVSFSYQSGRPTLTDVDFEIGRGEIVGVIGPSGAGKSTLAQLILGLRDPDTGSLSVAGVDLREVDRAWWTRHVAFVPQDALLLTGTVAENLRFFRDGISDNDMRRAAAQANVLSDIEHLPESFDTHLGQRGSQLSGGQRQRLSIARALVGQPDVLVLDEPTSALDGRSEALIRDTLAELKGRVTAVIIAHRMSTLEMCDRIMVVEGGRVTAFAAPRELMQDNAFFQRAMALAGISAAEGQG